MNVSKKMIHKSAFQLTWQTKMKSLLVKSQL